MVFDNAKHRCHGQTPALKLGGEERLEYFASGLLIHAPTVILDDQADVASRLQNKVMPGVSFIDLFLVESNPNTAFTFDGLDRIFYYNP